MIPFNFGNSMIRTLSDAVQSQKNDGSVVEDELNQQYHLNERHRQKENVLQNQLNFESNNDEHKKTVIMHTNNIHETSEIQNDTQPNTGKNEFKSTFTNNFPSRQNIKKNFGNSISNVNQRAHPTQSSFSNTKLNYSELVRNSTDFLRNIISSLQSNDDPYDMSDWEDDEAMKPMELDLDAEIVNGKKIPSWACGKQLAIAVSKQNQADGDRIFQDLDRRVDMVKLFETNVFPYYQQRNR